MKQLLKAFAVIIFFVSCLLLQSSATHYFPVLQYYFLHTDSKSTYPGLWLAAKGGSESALNTLTTLALANEEFFWLEKAASLNNLASQVALSRLSIKQDKRNWLRQAASNGHAPSQFELSLTAASIKQRITLLEQAASNGYIPAINALGKYYYEKNDAYNALKWLDKVSPNDNTNMFRMAKMLWQQERFEEATDAFERASVSDYVAAAYYSTIKSIPRQSLSALSQTLPPINEQCSQQLQFVATSLDSAVQADTFKKQFEVDESVAALPICINPVIWLAENELVCQLESQRNVCDLKRLASTKFTPSYTHMVFFLNEGKGYVHNGIMYLDKADMYTVFIHELAHFVGFVDEYAVPATLAGQYCHQTSAPNLMISENTDFSANITFKMWQSYYQKVMANENSHISQVGIKNVTTTNLNETIPISESLTCEALGKKSYKPSNNLTFMQFHDINYIPQLYLLMWQDLLVKHHHSIAVAQAFKLQAQHDADAKATTHWARM